MSLSSNRESKDREHGRDEDIDYDYNTPPYNTKKGVGFGAWAGFIGAIPFTGIMLSIPLILGLSVGTFLYAFGSKILVNPSLDQTTTSLAAFSLVLLQGIIVGVIFGVITSKVSKLHTSSKGKGVGIGLIAGVITFLVVYVPFMLIIFPAWLPDGIVKFPTMKLGDFGASNYGNNLSAIPSNYYLEVILGVGIIAYLVYGAIMSGIVTMSYSVFHFATDRGIKYANDARHTRANAGAA